MGKPGRPGPTLDDYLYWQERLEGRGASGPSVGEFCLDEGVSTVAFVWMVLKKGPLFAGMTTYVVPVLALLWGTFDHESISSVQAVSIAGVLAMVALVQTGPKADGELLETAAGGELVTSLPISAEAEHLVSLPIKEISLTDALASQPESQVA